MKQYIDKAAIIAEIKKRLHANGAFDKVGDEAWAEDVGMCNAYKSILSFLDTLEVKEMDLEKEINEVIHNYKVDNHRHTSICSVDIEWIAKHFFELGLKANYSITANDRGMAEEIIINLKRVEKDYRIDLTKEIEWLRNTTKKGD